MAVVLVVSAPGMSRPSSAQAPPAPRVAQTGSDFNGDGFDDLPVAAPEEDVEPLIDSGAVHVLYGTAEGLSGGSGQVWTQDSPGVPGVAESNEEFGRALASGDFDGDGFSDLAVGTPGEDDEGLGTTDSGAVNVLYGSAEGVTAAGAQYFTQDTPGVRDRVESFDQFGEGLGAADFNGDGFADLAVGAWGEGVGTVSSAGAVEVLYGSPAGLQATAPDDQFWNQDSPGVIDSAEDYDEFGYRMAAADFDGDGLADLAVGVPDEWVGSAKEAGAANVLYGSPAGLTAQDNQFWNQDSPGILDRAETEDVFSLSMAAGDMNGDGAADLAVGVPLDDVSGKFDGGGINVLYGSSTGLVADGNQFWTQDSPGILESTGYYDEFGWALTVRDYDGDGFADLAASADGEIIPHALYAGGVNVLYGTPSGLGADRNQFWTQNSPGILDTAEGSDYFGEAISSGDFNGDGAGDLAVGVPWEDLQALEDAGAVNVLFGATGGLSAVGNQFWDQDSPGVGDVAEAGDEFGWV